MRKYFGFGLLLMSAARLTAGMSGCSSSRHLETVTAETFEQGIETPGAQVLDVRDVSEYDAGHIEGAENISIDSPDFISEAQKNLKKDKPVYVYCRGGRRSKEAADKLVECGYNVVNLDGGLLNWQNKGLPVTPPDTVR